MRLEGTAICLGEDVDTDLIIAGRYLRTKDRGLWASRAFEDLDPALAKRLKGAIIVAGKNFGCGSSREQAAIALKEAGVVAVIAPSFGRIFFRNAINIGLPLLECECGCTEGAHVRIDLGEGRVSIEGNMYRSRPLSPRMLEILLAGGLVELWRCRR
ncbi:MAG: 3-isopropylmalate dehydratase [Methanomicrobiales archaeon]|jgi:methanogen homoaconitase small subunit|nr:3-isopropylmalate dehydratase [Methanomicrobiales archaeon]